MGYSTALTADTLVGAAGLIAVVVAAVYAFRYRTTLEAAQASAKAWQGERDAEAAHRARIEAELDQARREISELQGRLDELSRRPDLTILQALMERHETRAQERSERIVEVLHEIAASLHERTP